MTANELADSLDPLSTVAIFDLTPGSATFGARVPFRLELRTDTSVTSVVSHSLLLFPSIPFTGGGRYALVVTRRAMVDAERPFEPSPFFRSALEGAAEVEAEEVTRTRALTDDVLAALAMAVEPTIEADDVALVARFSIRSTDSIPRDLRAIKEQVLAAPPPSFQIVGVEPDADEHVAAIVRGTWQAPDWRDGRYLRRDEQGLPVQTGSRAVPFTLALPAAALDGPVPLTMYQHGNPGSSEREVPSQARRTLGEAGFAVIGFTDILNREVSPGEDDITTAVTLQAAAVVFGLLESHHDPDFWVETHAEQIAFLRMLSSLGTLDVLPIGQADGVPDIDAQTTAAFFQYVPVGLEGFPPTPGCQTLSPGSAREGHYCAQSAAESLRQRAVFFRSAVEDDVPTIIDPFSEDE